MKKDKVLKQIDEQIAAICWLDTADLEGELGVSFSGAKGDQVAEWVREFSLGQLRKLREWVNEQED